MRIFFVFITIFISLPVHGTVKNSFDHQTHINNLFDEQNNTLSPETEFSYLYIKNFKAINKRIYFPVIAPRTSFKKLDSQLFHALSFFSNKIYQNLDDFNTLRGYTKVNSRQYHLDALTSHEQSRLGYRNIDVGFPILNDNFFYVEKNLALGFLTSLSLKLESNIGVQYLYFDNSIGVQTTFFQDLKCNKLKIDCQVPFSFLVEYQLHPRNCNYFLALCYEPLIENFSASLYF